MKSTMKNSFKYHSLANMTVGMLSQEDYNLQVLPGRVIANEEDRYMTTPPMLMRLSKLQMRFRLPSIRSMALPT